MSSPRNLHHGVRRVGAPMEPDRAAVAPAGPHWHAPLAEAASLPDIDPAAAAPRSGGAPRDASSSE